MRTQTNKTQNGYAPSFIHMVHLAHVFYSALPATGSSNPLELVPYILADVDLRSNLTY